jgi:hypothetical protein
MNENLDPAAADDPADRPVAANRASNLSELLETSAPVASTALISAIEPKLPPFRGE